MDLSVKGFSEQLRENNHKVEVTEESIK